MTPNQLPKTGPTCKQWARSPANKVTNYLTLSIALVTLIAVAYATSTPQQQQQQQQQQHKQQQRHQQQRLISASASQTLLSSHKPHPHSLLKRSPSSTLENFEPLYERPRAYSNVAMTQNEAQNFDETDEEFLRQLKEAANYLDDKLAERQRQQQQLAILNQAPGFGRRLLESIGHPQQQQPQQQQYAYGYQEPTYGVLVDPQLAASSSGRASSANGWPNSNESDDLETESDTEDPEAGETNVVVIAPGHGSSRLISSLPNQVADYRLLTDQLQQERNQQQQRSFTDAKYKQLLKSILLDQAQANSLASSSPTENSKRDSSDGPAKSIDDSTKTEQQQQSQQPEEQQPEEQQQQQQPDQGSAAKYTTLLEDEQESSPVPTTAAAAAKPDEHVEVKARERTSGPAYGTLVYDQTAQRPAVLDGATSSSSSSSSWGVGSMLKRLYSNVAYYLPFLNQLTNLRQGGASNKVATGAEGTTTRGSQVFVAPVAESKQQQQQGNSIGIGGNSNEGNGRQQQQSIDNGLHAKANVSVSLLVKPSEEAKENHREISDHDSNDGVLENNGETNKQKQRDNHGDAAADADDDDDAKQDNQQSQTNDKEEPLLLKQQEQLLRHGLKNVKVTVDRKKTNDGTEDTEDDVEKANNSNNIKDNHYEDAADDDHFSGQFVNGNNGAQPSATAQDGSVHQAGHRAPKSWDLKRDRAPQSFVIENGIRSNNNPAELDMDMSQMVPAEVGHRPRYTTTDNDDADDENDEAAEHDELHVASDNNINNNNGYNLMKHSNLLVPIGSASDVPIRSSSSIRQQQQPDSLLGKYIYAPTQHYYLNSMIPSAALVGAGAGGPNTAGGPFGHQHRVLSSGGKHIQPGDTIYGSYAGNMPMKAAYAYQSEHTSIGNKPSDLYFLVMVGAFCVMAMAVVLAAGLFAYRIQQNRKSSQDTDYPTYGVVGPNNMSAKCGGAASFVGGYFTGPPSGSSKSGSAKHLPDLYGTPNGAGGSDSGLNSLDKSSSNKKAASVSSLNEHTHQPANSRTASSNFMAAASQDAARMYHYQHQKQQMIISDRNSGGRQTSASDLDSEDENDDGSYTVYECPGLASAHEMEIKNPLFNDDQSP